MNTTLWIAGLVVAAVVALVVWLAWRRRTRSTPVRVEHGQRAGSRWHADAPMQVDDDPFTLGGTPGDRRPPRAPPSVGSALPAPGAPAGGSPSPPAARHNVEASALVPESVVPGELFRIEAVLAQRGRMPQALAEARAGRDALAAAPPRTLTAPLDVGTVLELTLECAQADLIAPKVQRLQWSGTPLTAGFQVRPAVGMKEASLFADVNVFVDRICVGHLPLTLPVVRQAEHVEATPIAAAAAFEIPRRLFMSYTKADRAHVLPIARALKEIGVEAFMDRLSLEGGEDWESRLWREIDACDCFMLFWSRDSAASEWVQRETLRALQRQREGAQRRPKIVTHLLGKPPPAPPPPALASLHFNDPAYALWEAAVAAGEA